VGLGAVRELAPVPPAWRGHDISDFLAPPKIVRWFQALR